MERTELVIEGHKGAVPNTFFRQPEADHLAVIFPGWGYTCQMPLLYYTSKLLRDLGADVLQVAYAYNRVPGFRDLPRAERDRWLFSDVTAAFQTVVGQRPYKHLTLIGKSLGTHALSHLLSEGELSDARAVWLTPLLNDAGLLGRLARCSQCSLFVIGSADSAYDAKQLKALQRDPRREVEVIENADHSLEVPGNLDASLDALRRVIVGVRTFLT